MAPELRYAADTRTLLDLTAYELRRLPVPRGTCVAVHTAYPELLEDLVARLHDEYRIEEGTSAVTAPVHVLLWAHEERRLGAIGAALPSAEHLLVAFRNRLSHRSLVSRHFKGLWFIRFEQVFQRKYKLRGRWGVLAPPRVAWLLAAGVANRARRYDLGYACADRALLATAESGWIRVLCPLGLLVGSKP